MRKFGLLAALTIVGMLSFAATALAADGTPTDPASQGSANNGTGYKTTSTTTSAIDGSTVTFSGQSYRMDTYGNAGPAGTPQVGGTNGTGYVSPVPTDSDIKYDNDKIHSSYSKTSDACASCHTVHNSVDSSQGALLQWEDPQTACWACHDGTVASTYNVVTGKHTYTDPDTNVTKTQVNSGGLFGIGTTDLATEKGLSNHGMSPKEPAFVTTSAAPGGAESAVKDKNGNWGTEFSCVACHDPHGTLGNARILNPDVNGWATQQKAQMTSKIGTATLVQQADGTAITDNAPTSIFKASRTDVTLSNVKINGVKASDYLAGKKQQSVIVDNQVTFYPALPPNTPVTADLVNQGELLDLDTTDASGKTFVADKGNWMEGHGYDPVVHLNDVTQNTGFKINYLDGKVLFDTAPAPTDRVVVSYAPGMTVKMDVKGKLTASETVKYQSGINEFCGACHTDYNNVGKTAGAYGVGGAYKEALGEYRKAYRHSVGFTRTPDPLDETFTNENSLNASYPGLKFDTSNPGHKFTSNVTVDCLTCHYAHGTSDQFITESLTSLGQIGDFPEGSIVTADTSRTTALKRLPNMGVCQACHDKQGVANTSTPK